MLKQQFYFIHFTTYGDRSLEFNDHKMPNVLSILHTY